MRRLSPRRLTGAGFTIVLFAFMSLAALTFASGPAALGALQSAQQTTAQADKVREQLSAADPARADKKATERLAALVKAIPAGPELDDALAQTRASATSTGATWVSSSVARGADVSVPVAGGARQVASFTLTVAVDADRGQLAGALSAISAQARLTVIDSVASDGRASVITAHVYALAAKAAK